MTVAGNFREWLFARLKGSRFASCALPDERIDAVAKRLGVDPELLLEVRAEVRIERHERGLPSPKLQYKKRLRADPHDPHVRLYQYHLFMPEEVFAAWKEECAFRGLDGPLLLRSMIHEYLLGEREVAPLDHWVWRGKKYMMGGNKHRGKFLERSVIPHGAKRALTLRASLLGTTSAALVRALAVEALMGLHRDVALIEAARMFDDETRYNTG